MHDLLEKLQMRDALRQQWHQFIDLTESIRPQLHAYCRKLTPNIWAAEDLVQETLLRAFGTLAKVDDPILNPRAYILRIATDLWIDQLRQDSIIEYVDVEPDEVAGISTKTEQLAIVTDASRQLLHAVPPKQLAAFLMKDIFDASLEETAEALQTTTGAVKSLLSRSRANVKRYSSEPSQRVVPPVDVVERFVELFNLGDKAGLLELLLDNAVAGNVGTDTEWGYDGHRSPTSWLNGSMGGHPEWPAAFRFESQRAECVTYKSEPIVLVFRTRRGREAMEVVVRLTADESKISELRSYSFCPEVKREIASYFGIAVRAGRYRYPTPTPGASYLD